MCASEEEGAVAQKRRSRGSPRMYLQLPMPTCVRRLGGAVVAATSALDLVTRGSECIRLARLWS